MSNTTLSAGNRCCGVCNRWGGVRIPFGNGHFQSAVTCEVDTDAEGLCLGGGFAGMMMREGATCPKFEVWIALDRS